MPVTQFVAHLTLLCVVLSWGVRVVRASPDHLPVRRDDCVNPNPATTLADRMNTALNSSGPGYILSLCPSTNYTLLAPVKFAFPNQEISTVGYPTGNDRAQLMILGPVANGSGHTTAIDGTCPTCGGVKIRNIQINGTRNGGTKLNGGANIELGGNNDNQLVEYVKSFDSRSWSCLHVTQGHVGCNNATIQNNDIGPCGLDGFQQWADGISYSCVNGLVQNNMIFNPTDGGIVLFGSPGTLVRNNTIWIEKETLLGGINLVDYGPFNGSFTGVVVENNTIMGGFATELPSGNETKGDDQFTAIINMGIAIGPRAWFGDKYLNNVSYSAIVRNNQFSGAFGYAIALTSARNFTVTGNVLFGNTSFIGARGPNCSKVDTTPTSAPFIINQATVSESTVQPDFQNIQDGDTLTCIVPPADGDFWPFGGNPSNPFLSATSSSGSSHNSAGRTAALVIGIIAGITFVAVLAWFVRKKAIERIERNKTQDGSTDMYQRKYVREKDGTFSK